MADPIPSELDASNRNTPWSCEVTGSIIRLSLSFDSSRNNPELSVISTPLRYQVMSLAGTGGVTVNNIVKDLGITAICSGPSTGTTTGAVIRKICYQNSYQIQTY